MWLIFLLCLGALAVWFQAVQNSSSFPNRASSCLTKKLSIRDVLSKTPLTFKPQLLNFSHSSYLSCHCSSMWESVLLKSPCTPGLQAWGQGSEQIKHFFFFRVGMGDRFCDWERGVWSVGERGRGRWGQSLNRKKVICFCFPQSVISPPEEPVEGFGG